LVPPIWVLPEEAFADLYLGTLRRDPRLPYDVVALFEKVFLRFK